MPQHFSPPCGNGVVKDVITEYEVTLEWGGALPHVTMKAERNTEGGQHTPEMGGKAGADAPSLPHLDLGL